MQTVTTPLLPYGELLRRPSARGLRDTDVPSDATISLGLPTLRWGGELYAYFAAPTIRRPGDPVVQKAPDRWWALDARSGKLVAYALTAAMPFADGADWGDVTLKPSTVAVEELRAAYRLVASLIDRLAPFFFRGEGVPADERRALSAALAAVIPAPLQPQYRALVPDFFTWLDA